MKGKLSFHCFRAGNFSHHERTHEKVQLAEGKREDKEVYLHPFRTKNMLWIRKPLCSHFVSFISQRNKQTCCKSSAKLNIHPKNNTPKMPRRILWRIALPIILWLCKLILKADVSIGALRNLPLSRLKIRKILSVAKANDSFTQTLFVIRI